MPGSSRLKTWLFVAFAINLTASVVNGLLAFADVPFFPIRYAIDTATIGILTASIIGTVAVCRVDRFSWVILAATACLLLILQVLATTEIIWPMGTSDNHEVGPLARYVLQPMADMLLTIGAYALLYFNVTAWEKMTEARERAASQAALEVARQQLAENVEKRSAELAETNERLRREIEERTKIEADLRTKQRSLEGLIAVHDRDRQQVVYQIHDGLMQNLTGAMLHIESVGGRQPDMTEEARQECGRAFKLLRESMHVARGLLSNVRPPIIDEQGLVAGLEYLVAEHHKQCGPPVEFQHEIQQGRISPVVEGAVFGIAQEALHNVRRHGRAHRIELSVREVDDRLHLEIRDDGVGFDPATAATDPQQLGLRGMAARAQGLLGSFQIDSAPGAGTRIAVDVPAIDSLEREIEHRLSVERALAESERMYRLLADHSTDVISRHALDGATLYISPACELLFGFTPEEVMAKSPFELVHPDDQGRIAELLIEAAASTEKHFSLTFRSLDKEGNYRWIETVGRRVVDPVTGEAVEFVTNSREVTDRHNAEAALRTSEERYRTVINALPIGLYLSEGPAGHLVYANPAALAIWEASPDSFHPYVWHQGVHPDDRPWILAEVQRAIEAGRPFRGEFRSITPSGKEKWVRVVASFVVDEVNGRTRRVGMIEDVTERKLADEGRRRAEARHAELVRAIPDMVFRISREGVYLDYEPGEGILPLVPYEVFRGKRVTEILPEHVATLCLEAIGKALQTGRTQTIDFELFKNGALGHFEARYSPAGPDDVYAFVRELTDRVTAGGEASEPQSNAATRRAQES